MEHTTSSAVPSLATFLNEGIWRQVEGVINAATPWHLLLVDPQGCLVERGPPSREAAADDDPGPAAAAEPLRRPEARERFQEAITTHQPILLSEPHAGGEKLWVVAPIRTQDRVLGALLVGGTGRDDQSAEGQTAELLDVSRRIMNFTAALADLYAHTETDSQSLRARYAAQAERSSALQQLSALAAGSREIDPLARMVLLETRRLFGADRSAIFLRGTEGDLRCMGTIGLSQEYVDAVNRLYTQAAGGRAAATLDIVYVADAQADEVMGPLRAMAQAEGFHALIVVPFIRGGEAIGALALYHNTWHEYSTDDTAALNTFANQIAIAIDNAWLFEESQRQLARLTFLAEAGRMLNTSLELNQVFTGVAQAAARLIGGGCGLYLTQSDEPVLELRIYYDQEHDEQARREAYLEAQRPVLGSGPIGVAAQGSRSRLVRLEDDLAQADPYLRPINSAAYLAVPLRVQERVIGVLVLWLFNPQRHFSSDDITLAEALADRAAVALENARLYEQERNAQRAKDEFLSSVSHELRTPLTAIIGYTQLIRKRFQNDPAQSQTYQQMQVIWTQAERLHRLIETILDISRIERGQLQLQVEELHLRELLDAVVERIQGAARATLTFDVDVVADLCPLQGDRIRLEQVFAHLLSNAAKYSPADGIVRASVQQAGQQVVIEISDQGPGVRTMEAPRLFERYYQADTPVNRAGGLGLGLYVTRAIVEAHGGTIAVESVPGAGALFRVTLPCETSRQ
jgi:signal transduction histidine kinase